MSEFTAEIRWQHAPREGHPDDYSRAHDWQLAGGQTLRASSAPEYAGDPTRTNPEEALVAAVSSCHMLTFLAVAAKRGFKVTSYTDKASGSLGKNAEGRLAVTEVVLRPQITFDGADTAVVRRQMARFIAMWVGTTLVSTGAMGHIDDVFGLKWAWLAKPAVELGLGVIGFFLSRHWVYKA